MVRGGGCGSGGPTGPMIYVLYCLYSTWVGRGGGGLVGNNTLQLKFSSICFYCIISSKPWGGGGKLFRERVYNIFIYTQLFRVKNFSSICLYCIIVSVDIYTSHPPPPLPHPIFIFLIYCIHVGGGRGGGLDVVDQNNFVNLFCMKNISSI